ncbi:hypothetical protein QQX09_05055 [Demequina sp. SYSU T00192]|uniref:Uncharacterized protein n=1 Tax=Demequina litoralis TaxID=3051660 RepID=A0ABT8G845_9MICO|nr:hypothetical protein [Demequina sp. SYSU T00192]MDN4475227.1 hypothetical protein [Demequina sp. SYSU T00192]
MKGLREPVGDHPSEVYWRRRIVLLVALAVIVAVGWLIVSALSSDGAEPSEPAAASSPETSTSPTSSVSPSTEPTSADVEACAKDAISVSVAPNPANVPAGKQPKFAVTIEQTGDVPCLLDTTGKNTKLVITSGDERIWSSNDCPAEEPLIGKEWLLASGDSKEVQAAWPRIRSAEGCATTGDAMGEGWYWAEVTVAGVKADRVQFHLQ